MTGWSCEAVRKVADWWQGLTSEQHDRLDALINSRVRLLGETYAVALKNCTAEVSDDNKEWVLHGE